MPHNVRLHRVLTTRPEKVYRAFLEADALAKWLPPNGFACTVHHLDAKAGGTFRMSFRNFSTGNSHAFGGEYLELVPHERFVTSQGSSSRKSIRTPAALGRSKPDPRSGMAKPAPHFPANASIFCMTTLRLV